MILRAFLAVVWLTNGMEGGRRDFLEGTEYKKKKVDEKRDSGRGQRGE